MKHRVLLVEDSPDDQLLVTCALRIFGEIEVTIAQDGQEAVDYLLHVEHMVVAEERNLGLFCLARFGVCVVHPQAFPEDRHHRSLAGLHVPAKLLGLSKRQPTVISTRPKSPEKDIDASVRPVRNGIEGRSPILPWLAPGYIATFKRRNDVGRYGLVDGRAHLSTCQGVSGFDTAI